MLIGLEWTVYKVIEIKIKVNCSCLCSRCQKTIEVSQGENLLV